MCGFAGFAGFSENLWEERYLWGNLGKRMAGRIAHRGPNDRGTYVSKNVVLSHARLAVMDPLFGKQPMTFKLGEFEFAIAYNGEIYNTNEIKRDLLTKGYTFDTRCDTEVLLKAYIEYGEDCPNKLNGIFAFVVDDPREQRLFMCRDRFGVKPLFYTMVPDRIVFASEIKSLFEYPGVRPIIDKQGLQEIIGIGPARTSGCGVFKDIYELKPSTIAIFDKNGFREKEYFKLVAHEIEDSYEQAVLNVRELLEDIAERQMVSDVPICTFLSGGLDSSVVTALASKTLKDKNLQTYSFDFEGNSEYFSPTKYEPSADEPWARMVSNYLGTEHTTLICSTDSLYKSLFEAVIAKDLPGMADVDSSLLQFCKEVKENHDVVLCGECADEVFGGYPWFMNKEDSGFPWSREMDFRNSLINKDLAEFLNIKEYSQQKYQESIESVSLIGNENAEDKHWRKMTYLNIKWFMQTLLDRKDRCSMYSGLEVRVPYADHRLIEYIYNCPWDYKYRNGQNKYILRDAAQLTLPQDILFRKKKPYPKTHNPKYEQQLKEKLRYVLRDKQQPIHKIISEETAKALLKEKFDYGKPWFGQLMAGPQLLAYILQINYWLIRYNIYLDI